MSEDDFSWAPEAHREMAKKIGAKSMDDVFRHVAELDSLRGRSLGHIPEDPSKAEEVLRGVAKKLGAPDDPDKYELPEDLTPPDKGGIFAGEIAAKIRRLGVEKGVHPSQMKAIVSALDKEWVSTLGKAQEARKAQSEKTAAELKQAWGQDYDRNITRIRATIAKAGLSDQETRQLAETMDANPALYRSLAKVAQDTVGEGKSIPWPSGTVPEENKEQKFGELAAKLVKMKNMTERERDAFSKEWQAFHSTDKQ